ncbi:MAG: dTDP-4-dehydrorhamnose reductase [Bacteroidota bacterium]
MKKILVTGANGQLGRCLRDAASSREQFEFYFADRSQLDVASRDSVEAFFANKQFDYCINTAAYTNVEKAESEADAAFATNSLGVKSLAQACKAQDITLLHVSTDYVFDGTKNTPYVETDPTAPLNVYGASKLAGEEQVSSICETYFVIRTSWLYCQYGHNFLNSMLRFAEEGRALSITTEQLGTPTNANDLALAMLGMIEADTQAYGLYHFSNEGEGTWYDFAEAIFRHSNQLETVKLAKTEQYRTFAKRPAYSVLNKEKFANAFDVPLVHWEESLKQLIENHK